MTLARLYPIFYLFSLLGMMEVGDHNFSSSTEADARTVAKDLIAQEEEIAYTASPVERRLADSLANDKLPRESSASPTEFTLDSRCAGDSARPHEGSNPSESSALDLKDLKDAKDLVSEEPDDYFPPAWPSTPSGGGRGGWMERGSSSAPLSVPEPNALMLVSVLVIVGLNWRKIV
jgi:hypothetical protein